MLPVVTAAASAGAATPAELAAEDPLTDAELRLAEGHYDEAALLLTQAAQKNPERSELRVRLAETWFAAGKAAEFRETAQTLQPQLAPEQWQKLAILGRQSYPDDALFAADPAVAMRSVDLALEAPAQGAATQRADGAMLEFTLDAATPAAPAGSAAAADSKASDPQLDLSEFDLGPAVAAGDPARLSPAAAEVTRELDALTFDLGDVDALDPGTAAAQLSSALQSLPGRRAPNLEPEQRRSPVDAAALPEFDLGEIELALDEPAGDEPISDDDEIGTKLDLARAYVEMEDMDMARNLLGEVLSQGSEVQCREATELMGRFKG